MLVDLKTSLQNSQLLNFINEAEVKWQVCENQYYIWLLMNDTVQSIMNKAEPSQLTLPHQQPLKGFVDELPDNANILEFGLGGASNARYFNQQKPCSQITVVEQSAAVIELFKTYFNPQKSNINTIHQSAEHFILSDQKNYHLIITDLFKSGCSLLSFINAQYFIALKNRLTPNGFAYLNFIPDTPAEAELIKTYIQQTGLTIQWADKIIGFKNWVFLVKNTQPNN